MLGQRKPARPRTSRDAGALVIGVGRFGSAIATTLDALGQDVLAMERNEKTVAQWVGRFPIVQGDATDPEALDQIGAGDFGVAVVGIATSLEASVLVTANLADLGVPQIWAKATSVKHGKILEKVGANHLVYPEFDSGARVAHLVSGKMLDYIEVEDGFTIVKMLPPQEMLGYSLAESNVRRRYGVTVIGVKTHGSPFRFANAETQIQPTDAIVVSGTPQQ
ncbi:MAG: TrkA family potassium uptake protein, partial [Promicromonosporaceae bacterium]|nr:TrkA family potassium uptake protein [Promicromonosporaceae bacterium]